MSARFSALGLCTLVGALWLAWAGPVDAKPYLDTKKRFQIEPAPGWELAPLPGDTSGMNFKKKIDGVPGLLHVAVEPLAPGQTPKQTLEKKEAPFKNEIGFNPGTDVPVDVGGFGGTRRTLSVFASGDRKTVRAVELYVVHAFGFAHIIHFETLEKQRGSFTRDLDRMLASYQPLIGRELAAPLAGLWINTSGGPDLTLEESSEFRMGPLYGGWRTDGGMIELKISQGAEKYRYVLNGDTLTLSSPNLGEDLVFRRSTSKRPPKEAPKVRPPGPVTREELIGAWRVIDAASTEPLRLQLAPSGTVAFGPLSGNWRFSTGRLTITSTAGVTITYAASMNDGKLVLSGGDLDQDATFERE